jgi:hypothetical protein
MLSADDRLDARMVAMIQLAYEYLRKRFGKVLV